MKVLIGRQTTVTNLEVYDNSAAVAYGPTSNGRGRLDYDRITDAKLRFFLREVRKMERNITTIHLQ